VYKVVNNFVILLVLSCSPPMHQCEVTTANENIEGSSLHLENKGAGEDVIVSASSDASAAVSTNPGILLVFI